MTAALTPNPKVQFFAADGTPLVGGKLYSYVAGTTTPLATYINYAGVTANTNPVILDSRGEANVWLDNVLYKLALYDANDALIWTVDNVSAVNTGIFTGPVAGTTGTFSGALTAADLTINGATPRIRADFSNATLGNRAYLQTTTVNGSTIVGAIPNGTGPSTFFSACNSSTDQANASFMQIGIDGSVAYVRSTVTGTGTNLPLTFWTNNVERMRIALDGTTTIGTSTGPNFPLVSTGLAAAGTVWSRFANGSGTASSVVALSLDPGNNGVNTRDASIRAINNGANQIQLSFYTSNAATPAEALRITPNGSVFAINQNGALGYGTGAGGTVTQATSKSTPVLLDRPTGIITMNAASLAANTTVSFTLTNSAIAIGDVLVVCQGNGGTGGAYQITCSGVYAGSASISVRNTTVGALLEAVTINFAIIKGASA